MPQTINVSLPVTDLSRARAFYAALGLAFDDRFSDATTARVVVSDAISLMLMTRDRFADFAPHPVGDPWAESLILVSLSRESREDVIACMAAGVAAGGTDTGQVDEVEGAFYGASISDPDGNALGLMWMDLAKMAPTLPAEMDAAVDA